MTDYLPFGINLHDKIKELLESSFIVTAFAKRHTKENIQKTTYSKELLNTGSYSHTFYVEIDSNSFDDKLATIVAKEIIQSIDVAWLNLLIDGFTIETHTTKDLLAIEVILFDHLGD